MLRALELAPTASLYRKRSQLHATHRDHTAALRDTDDAIRLGSGKENADEIADDQLHRGQLLFRLKKWDDALKAYDAALVLTPDRPAAHQARGEALLELGRYTEAAAAMDRYQAKGPPQALASRARGLCRAKLGQYPGAIEDYTRALEIERAEGKPADAPTLAYRGWAYLVMDAPKLAVRDFDAAVQLSGTHRAAECQRRHRRRHARSPVDVERSGMVSAPCAIADTLGVGRARSAPDPQPPVRADAGEHVSVRGERETFDLERDIKL